ncbi:MAG: SRPBCC family protein [Kineosporiaceae bacterium]
MTLDTAAIAGLVTREIRSGSRDGTPTKIAIARRTYRTNRADLWHALTDPDRIPRWFLPVTGDLRVGGRYQLEGNAGGVVERCDEPDSFAVTWEYGDTVSWLRVRLSPAAEGTVLELVHEAPVDPGFWEQFGPGAVGVGWDLGLWGLDRHVETGASVDPAAAEALATSPEGMAFIERAAAGWAAAAVADGDEADPAHEAAARTVAFYTGRPEGSPDAG